jgi:hypothetical protein
MKQNEDENENVDKTHPPRNPKNGTGCEETRMKPSFSWMEMSLFELAAQRFIVRGRDSVREI